MSVVIHSPVAHACLAALVLLAAEGCGAHHEAAPDAGSPDSGVDAGACGPAPENHRPGSVGCPTTRPAGASGDAGVAHVGACSTDEDCLDGGANGRCVITGAPARLNCTFDDCFTDHDCADGGVCGCRDDERYGINACLPANCRIDSDCGACGYCSPTSGGCFPYVGIVGYFCHTKDDECVNDSDCAARVPGTSCTFDPTKSSRWTCSPLDCTG